MGRVRTKTVKKAARSLVENYYHKLTLDFDINKRLIDEVAVIQTKRLRNKIAGFTTHLMKRILKGSVRGISLKLQEEEREKQLDFLPDKSCLDVETVMIDQDTLKMVRRIGGITNMERFMVERRGRGGRGGGRGGQAANRPPQQAPPSQPNVV